MKIIEGQKALTKMMGSKVFDNPKSINLLKKIIKFTTKDNDIVLDFFGGSGSTGEALLEVNKEEKTNRTFIICEQLDYVESVTVARVQKCLDEGDFIYCELANLNETFSEEIKKTKSKQDLIKVWQNIKAKGLLSWRVKLNEVEQLIETISEKELTTLKNLLYEVLDKNQMYVPLSEIDDNDYNLSNDNKTICNLFFKQKI